MSRTIKAGDLKHPVTLQKPTRSTDAKGKPITTYTDVITVYADKSDVSGREFYAAQAYHAEDTVTFTIRWRDELKDTWRVKHGGVIYEINEINHLGYMQDFMRLKCKALAGQGGAA